MPRNIQGHASNRSGNACNISVNARNKQGHASNMSGNASLKVGVSGASGSPGGSH